MVRIVSFLLGVLCWVNSSYAEAEQNKIVYQVDILEEIGPKVWRLVKKSFRQADEVNADYILIRMNTYGGMVVYADSLRSLILNQKRPVWVFIDNNAASAGALISIACDRIYMREGANIGAATVVNQSGEAMPDKYQSYMRSMIRSTAQSHGMDTLVSGRDTVLRWRRDPRIAEAMVDQSIFIDGLSDSGKIVTFTPHEAIRYGFCDGIADNIEEVLSQENVGHYTLYRYVPTVMDKVIGFLINPILQGLLVMIIVGGIYFELQTPGIGFPLAAAAVACLLYFAPLYLEGIADSWEIFAFIAGVVLLILEIFVIPGFGVAGISGIVLILGALVFAAMDKVYFSFPENIVSAVIRPLLLVAGCAFAAMGVCMCIGVRMLTSRKWAFALHAEQKAEDGYVGVDMSIQATVGMSGMTVTDLRPAGKVRIGTDIYDAVSLLGDYIAKENPVTVRKFMSGQVYVVRE